MCEKSTDFNAVVFSKNCKKNRVTNNQKRALASTYQPLEMTHGQRCLFSCVKHFFLKKNNNVIFYALITLQAVEIN